MVVAHTLRMSSALLHSRPTAPGPAAVRFTHTPTDENTVSQLLRHQLSFLTNALGIKERPTPAR